MIEPSSSEEEDEEYMDSSDFGKPQRGGPGYGNNTGAGMGANGTGPRLDVPNGTSLQRSFIT